jgi:hypothetical protein
MIIKKDTHGRWRWPKFIFKPVHLHYKITFTDSCRYELSPLDQADINKLFGIGYFPWHKINSVRFAWRYDKQSNKIEVLSYLRSRGKFYYHSIAFLDIGKEYEFILYRTGFSNDTCVLYISQDKIKVNSLAYMPALTGWGYLLHPYFGGNAKAPHDIEIKMEKYCQCN